MSIIAQAISTIADLVKAQKSKVEKIQVADRHFIINHDKGTHEEVVPRFEDLRARPAKVIVRDLASLALWAAACPGGPTPQLIAAGTIRDPDGVEPPVFTPGTVVTSLEETEAQTEGEAGLFLIATGPGQSSRAVWPRVTKPHEKRSHALMPFFDDYLPPKNMREEFVAYVDFLKWLDLVHDRLNPEDREILDMQLETITGTDSAVQGVTQSGAVLQVETKTSKGATVPQKIPKTIRARIPYGDPGNECDVTFALTLKIGGGGAIMVRVQPLPEPATSQWIAHARASLAEMAPWNWPTMVGSTTNRDDD